MAHPQHRQAAYGSYSSSELPSNYANKTETKQLHNHSLSYTEIGCYRFLLLQQDIQTYREQGPFLVSTGPGARPTYLAKFSVKGKTALCHLETNVTQSLSCFSYFSS